MEVARETGKATKAPRQARCRHRRSNHRSGRKDLPDRVGAQVQAHYDKAQPAKMKSSGRAAASNVRQFCSRGLNDGMQGNGVVWKQESRKSLRQTVLDLICRDTPNDVSVPIRRGYSAILPIAALIQASATERPVVLPPAPSRLKERRMSIVSLIPPSAEIIQMSDHCF